MLNYKHDKDLYSYYMLIVIWNEFISLIFENFMILLAPTSRESSIMQEVHTVVAHFIEHQLIWWMTLNSCLGHWVTFFLALGRFELTKPLFKNKIPKKQWNMFTVINKKIINWSIKYGDTQQISFSKIMIHLSNHWHVIVTHFIKWNIYQL